MARLPYVEASSAHGEVRRALERLPDLNVFKLMANAETAFVPWLKLGGVLLSDLALDPVLRELAILRVASLTPGAEYEWVQHVAVGEQVGVRADQIAAIESGDIGSEQTFSEVERLVLAVVDAVIRDGSPADEQVEALLRVFPAREIIELLMVVGSYRMLGSVMATARIDLDPPAGAAVLESSRRRPRR